MSRYSNFPPRQRNRASAILTISVVVSLMLLFGIGSLFWLVQNRFLLAPTPTPTATPAPPLTATPDFRATGVMEDMLTQVAYSATLIPHGTPSAAPTNAISPTAPTDTPLPSTGAQPQTPTVAPVTSVPLTGTHSVTSSVMSTTNLPLISNISALPTLIPTATPVVESALPTPTPTPVVATPNPPTPTATPLPPPTATQIPSPTPTRYSVDSLNAVIRNADTLLRLGPSNLYGAAGTLPANAGVKLLGRDGTGEWVYICCVNNVPYWVRQAYAQPRDNPTLTPSPTPTNPVATVTPTIVNPNDVRWLPIQPVASSLEPLPPPTAIPADDYPLVRHDAGNRARVPRVPRTPLIAGWASPGLAGSAFNSAVVVGGRSVLAASADNQLYCFDRSDGHQRWRFDMAQHIPFPPTFQDANIYAIDDSGRVFALQDQENAGSVVWQRALPKHPTGSVVVAGNNASKLYVSATDGNENQLYALNRSTGEPLTLDFRQNGASFQAPVVGGQLLYIGGASLWAVDVENFERVWTNTEIKNVSAPPVYTANGVVALAELYVADSASHLYSVDANTGVILWHDDSNESVLALAVNSTAVFVAGNNYLKAIARTLDHSQLWRIPINGRVLGGPIVDEDQLLLITESGEFQYVNVIDGSTHIELPLTQATLGGAAAVSGSYIFAPGVNGDLYALRENR